MEQVYVSIKLVNKVLHLTRPFKDWPLPTPAVYETPCNCGSVYIGENEISIYKIVGIHETKNEDAEKSAIAECLKIANHDIIFKETKFR